MSQTLADLSIGSKVKFGKYQVNTEDAQPIIWTIVAKNHTGYPENSVTLHATEILDLRCMDAKEPNNSDSNRANYGNNRYSLSNLDQWLNKNNAANEWYVATHAADQSPDYASRPGFLNSFNESELDAILLTTIRIVIPSLDDGNYEDISRKVFLPSITEVGLGNENNIPEGSSWGYYTSDANRKSYLTEQCFNNTSSANKPTKISSSWMWWLRTPYYGTTHYGEAVDTIGGVVNGIIRLGRNGIRPALNLSSSLQITDSADSDNCYTITFGTPTGSDVTLNGNTYSGVTNINYVKNGASYSLNKLIVNGSIIWTK